MDISADSSETSKMIVWMKDGFSKVQMDLESPTPMITISNVKMNSMIQLMDVEEYKFMMKYNLDSMTGITKSVFSEVFKCDSDSKVIAGYFCKKAEIILVNKKLDNKYFKLMGDTLKYIVYYTEDIPVADYNSPIKGMTKGYPLQIEAYMAGKIIMTEIAETVDKKILPDSDFAIPAGYTEMSNDETKAIMQQIQSGH